MGNTKKIIFAFCLMAVFSIRTIEAYEELAPLSESEYLKQLGVMQKHVQGQKLKKYFSQQHRESFIGNSVVNLEVEKIKYHLGDSWKVAFYPHDQKMARKSESPEDLKDGSIAPIFFSYTVVEIGADKSISIEIRQILDANTVSADPLVDHIVLVLNSKQVGIRKELYYKGPRGKVSVALNGQSNVSLGFESYPTILPDFFNGDPKMIQELPEKVKSIAGVDQNKVLDFHFSDLYARPIRVLWSASDPWPLYVESSSGVAVLLQKRTTQ